MLRFLRHLFRRKTAFLQTIPAAKQEHSLPDLNRRWACCSDFADRAKNHCHAVCLCNLLSYLFPKQQISFSEVHKIVKNGPVFTLRKAKRLFSSYHLPLSAEKLRNYEDLKTALSHENPCMILMANHLCDWHWILALGFAETDDGQQFVRIADGWHPDCDRWYAVEKNAEWLAAYTIKKT